MVTRSDLFSGKYNHLKSQPPTHSKKKEKKEKKKKKEKRRKNDGIYVAGKPVDVKGPHDIGEELPWQVAGEIPLTLCRSKLGSATL